MYILSEEFELVCLQNWVHDFLPPFKQLSKMSFLTIGEKLSIWYVEDKKVRFGCVVTFSESSASQNDFELMLLFVQEWAFDSQKSLRGGIPRPACSLGVNMSFLGTIFLLLEFMKLTTRSSICWRIFLLGRGSIVAMYVNFDSSEVLAIFTLPKILV